MEGETRWLEFVSCWNQKSVLTSTSFLSSCRCSWAPSASVWDAEGCDEPSAFDDPGLRTGCLLWRSLYSIKKGHAQMVQQSQWAIIASSVLVPSKVSSVYMVCCWSAMQILVSESTKVESDAEDSSWRLISIFNCKLFMFINLWDFCKKVLQVIIFHSLVSCDQIPAVWFFCFSPSCTQIKRALLNNTAHHFSVFCTHLFCSKECKN